MAATASSPSRSRPRTIVSARKRCYDLPMPTRVSVDRQVEHELWTASEFLFCRREGELLVEFAAGEAAVRSLAVDGFWMERSWLDPERLPKIAEALAKVTG